MESLCNPGPLIWCQVKESKVAHIPQLYIGDIHGQHDKGKEKKRWWSKQSPETVTGKWPGHLLEKTESQEA